MDHVLKLSPPSSLSRCLPFRALPRFHPPPLRCSIIGLITIFILQQGNVSFHTGDSEDRGRKLLYVCSAPQNVARVDANVLVVLNGFAVLGIRETNSMRTTDEFHTVRPSKEFFLGCAIVLCERAEATTQSTENFQSPVSLQNVSWRNLPPRRSRRCPP